MGFFKKLGATAGGLLGIRSGASAQQRQYQQDWNEQYQLKQAELQAQLLAIKGQHELTQEYDKQQEVIDQLTAEEQRRKQLSVQVGTASTRNFFRYGL